MSCDIRLNEEIIHLSMINEYWNMIWSDAQELQQQYNKQVRKKDRKWSAVNFKICVTLISITKNVVKTQTKQNYYVCKRQFKSKTTLRNEREKSAKWKKNIS
jgi:uncharacterized protein YlxW (UPF0749 family)